MTLDRLPDLLKLAGAALGVAGALVALVRGGQEFLAARRRRCDDGAYKAWLGAVVSALHAQNVCIARVDEDSHALAARAVSEGHLAWAPIPRHVQLPGR